MSEKKKNIDDLKSFFSDLDEEDAISGEYNEIDQLVDEVMALLEGYGNVSGGIITFKTVFEFLKSHRSPDLEPSKVEAAMKQMKKDRIIDAILTIDDVLIYIFQPIEVNEDFKGVLHVFIQNPRLTREELSTKLGWSNEKFDKEFQNLQENKLIKELEGKWVVPGLANA